MSKRQHRLSSGDSNRPESDQLSLNCRRKVPSRHDSVKLHKCVELSILHPRPCQSLSARLRSHERNGGIAFTITSLLFMIDMRTRSTRLVSIILAISVSASISSLPARLAEAMGNSFLILKNASGVHFFTGDDAVGAHSPKDFSVRGLLAVFTERHPRFKNLVSHTHSLFLEVNRQRASFFHLPQTDTATPANRIQCRNHESLLPVFCKFLI